MTTPAATPRCGRYSCDTAAETLEWMTAIAAFLKPFKPLIDAHVVNFFKDRLWEVVDGEWMDCLRKEPIENLLNIPSGFVSDLWPNSLQQFVRTIGSLVMPRDQESLHELFPNLEVTALNSVLAQGMNAKKRHEIEILAALVNAVAHSVGTKEIIDVGAGQGYLAQILSFQYQHYVTAIDASSHHLNVTNARAERIKKHYAAKFRKSQTEDKFLCGPQTVTCHILSSGSLSALTTTLLSKDTIKHPVFSRKDTAAQDMEQVSNVSNHAMTSVVLTGLHACGDLSVNMLRAFVESHQIKALVCIGCCYNLLSEEHNENASISHGFPMSIGTKSHGVALGKNARDLSCQSADRWRNLSKDDALENFYLHIFRAALQVVLDRYYPDVLTSSPSIGRQGKALRRQRMRRMLQSKLDGNESIETSCNKGKGHCQGKDYAFFTKINDLGVVDKQTEIGVPKYVATSRAVDINSLHMEVGRETHDKYELFKEFSISGLRRLGFDLSADVDILCIWKEAHPFFELVGPFWSLRASLGSLLETYILLDRLLFLQEHTCPLKVMMFPLFDPTMSPRNVVIVAQK